MDSMTRRAALKSAAPLALLAGSAPALASADEPAAPFAGVIHLGIQVFELLIWTPEAWAALPEADRPARARLMHGGAVWLMRDVDSLEWGTPPSPDPLAAARAELKSAREDLARAEHHVELMRAGQDRDSPRFADRTEAIAVVPARERLARAEARIRTLG